MPKYRIAFYRVVELVQEVEVEADNETEVKGKLSELWAGLEEGDWEWNDDLTSQDGHHIEEIG